MTGAWCVVIHLTGAPASYNRIVGPFRGPTAESRALRYAEQIEKIARSGGVAVQVRVRPLNAHDEPPSSVLALLIGYQAIGAAVESVERIEP